MLISSPSSTFASSSHKPKSTSPAIISIPTTNTQSYTGPSTNTGPSSNTPSTSTLSFSSSKHSSSSPTLNCHDMLYNGTCPTSLQSPTQPTKPTTLAPGIPVTSNTCPKGFTLQSDGSCLNTDPFI